MTMVAPGSFGSGRGRFRRRRPGLRGATVTGEQPKAGGVAADDGDVVPVRAGWALTLTAGGRAVNSDDLHGPVPVRGRRQRPARWEVEHEAAVRAVRQARA
jgi:hypothetical protein